MKNITLIARIALGLIFFVFGLNSFYRFMPFSPFNESAGVFIGGLIGMGYFFKLLNICEVLAGLSLLTGYFMPFALALLAPITVNIFLFHLYLDKDGLLLSIIIISTHAWLLWYYRKYFMQLFTMKVS